MKAGVSQKAMFSFSPQLSMMKVKRKRAFSSYTWIFIKLKKCERFKFNLLHNAK